MKRGAQAAEGPPNLPLITFGAMLATVMQALDTTIANVALPQMQGTFSVSYDQVTWVLTSYIVAAAIMTPPTGWLSNRFGRKRLYLVSVTGFTIASVFCGMASSVTVMVLFRILQGMFGAALVPLSQATLLDSYPRERHGPAMAIWGVGIMVGPILGPTLGGYLTDNYSWRWVFYINVPVGILAFMVISSSVRETARNLTLRFDTFGFAMISLAIAALQMFLDRGELKDWFGSPEIITEAVMAGLFLYIFLVHTFTAANPFISPSLFLDRNFSVSLVLIAAVGVVLYATMALLPPLMQDLLNYPVVTAGRLRAPRGVGTMIAMLIVGRIIVRIDVRILLIFGFALSAYSLYWMDGFSLAEPTWEFVASGVTQGFGLGFVFVPLTTVAFSTLAPDRRNEAAGIYNLFRNIGSSAGISAMTALLLQNTQISHEEIGAHITAFNPLLHLPGIERVWNPYTAKGLALLNHEVTRQASMIAYLDDFKFLMILTALLTPLVLLLRPPKTSRSQGQVQGQPAHAILD